MSIPDTKIQERLSIAYINAVSFYAGYGFQETGPSVDFGIDGEITRVSKYKGKYSSNGALLYVQVKATYKARESRDFIHYDLSRDAYEKLKEPTGLPQILVVYVMPKNKKEWLILEPDKLVLSKCAHWISASDIPKMKSRQGSEVVYIPKVNVFDSETIEELVRPVVDRIMKANINA